MSVKKINSIWKMTFTGLMILSFIALTVFFNFTSYFVDKSMNATAEHQPYLVTTRAESLHSSLFIMDWHSDALLWDRSLLMEHEYGHVDLPRLQKGNVALQMFTTVTKSPAGQNYDTNAADSDRITPLVVSQLWPPKTWGSLLERALYQAEKLEQFIRISDKEMVFIKTKKDLETLMIKRRKGKKIVGAMLGSEGAHPLEGALYNIDKMYDAGFRMMGLTHFFDNEVGGSLHGAKKGGLTDFGHKAVAHMVERGMIIDLSHASIASVKNVLAKHKDAALVISHTGMRGVCDSPRNFPDGLMKAIAGRGGLIGIGYWDGAICDASPIGIVKNIIYAVNLVGVDHVVLGSDWDGAVAAIQPQELNIITQNLISTGMSYSDIRKIMGGNSLRFLMENLPDQ